jgi:hypothetical protein
MTEQPAEGAAAPPTVADIARRLGQWQAATLDLAAVLGADRREVETQSNRLESPVAILAYVDFFLDAFARAAAEVGRVAGELASGPRQEHVDALRQLASNAAVEQRRCGIFRDKWINRTLPYEQVRPLLNHISTITRDWIAAHRELHAAADGLLQTFGPPSPPPTPGDAMDRRALFNRLLRRDER